jgi:hypothetical protein
MLLIDNLEARVESFLGQLGLEGAFRARGVTALDGGGGAVLVTCFEQDEDTWCRIVAVALCGIEPTLDVLHDLLRRNRDVLFGAWQLFDDGTVAFSVTLPGGTLDSDGFAKALRYASWVASSAAPQIGGASCGARWPQPS